MHNVLAPGTGVCQVYFQGCGADGIHILSTRQLLVDSTEDVRIPFERDSNAAVIACTKGDVDTSRGNDLLQQRELRD